jgi:hypothetical protein
MGLLSYEGDIQYLDSSCCGWNIEPWWISHISFSLLKVAHA